MKNCKFDSCTSGPCASLEQAAEECKVKGCIDWRSLTNGTCGMYLLSFFLYCRAIPVSLETLYICKHEHVFCRPDCNDVLIKSANDVFLFKGTLTLITSLFLFMFQMCLVMQDWFTENVQRSRMDSAMEGLFSLL